MVMRARSTGRFVAVPVADRFWAKVDKRGPDECWEWQGFRDKDGYGNAHSNGRPWGAHRVAYELLVGPIPDGLWVLHSCDNPPCCNIAHLFLGTHMDNVRDRDAKHRNRPPKGERHGCAKLTANAVADIRKMYATGKWSQRLLGLKYGVNQSHVSAIVRGKYWGQGR